MTLLCDRAGVPVPRQTLRTAIQENCGLFGPGGTASAAVAVGLRIRRDTAIVGLERGVIERPP